jgi:hypothetical protein
MIWILLKAILFLLGLYLFIGGLLIIRILYGLCIACGEKHRED